MSTTIYTIIDRNSIDQPQTAQTAQPTYRAAYNRNISKPTEPADWVGFPLGTHSTAADVASEIDRHVDATLARNPTGYFPPHCWAIVRD